MAEKWISGAITRPGAFAAKAKAAGKSTAAYARQVLKPSSTASTRTKRQANLARTLRSFHSGRAKFCIAGFVLALAFPVHAENRICPAGYLTASTGQTSTGPSVDTVTARSAPALVFQFVGGGASATAQVEMCCSPLNCGAGATWAPVQGSAVTLTAGSYGAVVSVLSPTCVYRANVTACTSCSVTAIFHCAGS